MVGQVVAQRYQIIQPIGEGGMALVYLARDLRTGHQVAVKFLRPEFKQNPDFLARFQREAMAASKMSHHNIVNLLDVSSDSDNPYIVIEYVNGKTLKDIIRDRKRLPEDVAAQIAIRILSALQHAHQAGIIHRDIKPQNILVNQQGYIKVSDFGIARMVGANTATLTDGNKSVLGSVHYFSPEQARGETATVPSDIYSVGVVLYEMLTGQVPFEGESSVAIALQHVQVKPRPPRELVDSISPSIEGVVMKALEKEQPARYHTALEMAQALKLALQFPEKEITLDTPILTIEKPKRALTPQRRKRISDRLLMALVSVFLMVILVLGSVLIYRSVVSSTRAPYLMYDKEQDAIRKIEMAGLVPRIERQVSSEPAGTVILQSHDFDHPMKRGDSILIMVSTGPAQQAVPQVSGKLEAEAQAELERMGFRMLVTDRRLNPAPAGTVLSQLPLAGEELAYGGIVQVQLSGGEIKLPELKDQSYEEQLPKLKKLGLLVSLLDQVPTEDVSKQGRIATQSPAAGTLVMAGATVDLVVYIAPGSTPLPNP